MNKKITKEVLADIIRNYKFPLLGALGLEIALIWTNVSDPMEPWQFWIATAILTAVYPACIIYGIMKYYRMKSGSNE